LGFILLLKINYFGWLLFAWFCVGMVSAYGWTLRARQDPYRLGPLSLETIVTFAVYGSAFGAVSRLLLLRWRSTMTVALVLATMVCGAVVSGALHRLWGRTAWSHREGAMLLLGSTEAWLTLSLTFGWVALGAALAFPLWAGLAKLLLPPRAARTLLKWQMGSLDA
jgi:hypothetical protein